MENKMYAVVSIGNTDNRLTQKEWSRFVEDVEKATSEAGKLHYFGGASTWAPWQNVAWIVELDGNADNLECELERIRKEYNQQSAFLVVGDGRFI
jgi:hypothetical protein